jgi:hypothetical protein
MASKAARKRRRLEEERRQLASLETSGAVHTGCSAVTLGTLDALLVEADRLLDRIVAETRPARSWPRGPATHELLATLEDVGDAAVSSRARLATARHRAHRLHTSGVHVHMCGDLAVRMVPLATTVEQPARSTGEVSYAYEVAEDGDDIPF